MTRPDDSHKDDMADRWRAVFGSEGPVPCATVLPLPRQAPPSRLGQRLHDHATKLEVSVTIDDDTKALRNPAGSYRRLGRVRQDHDPGLDVLRGELASPPESVERFMVHGYTWASCPFAYFPAIRSTAGLTLSPQRIG